MILKKHFFLFLLAIVFLAGFLRFYQINKVPVSLYWDGVASSYNAYSILKTGKDEYGTFMPILFRSFDDYKMPGNIYLTIIPVAIFGLNEFSTRFTSAFSGTCITFFVFYLVQEFFLLEIFDKKKEKTSQFAYLQKYRKEIGLLVAFFFALSPWSIQFSRVEFEANVGLMFTIPAIILFLQGIRKKQLTIFLLSSILFALSMYFYRSIIVFIPFLLVSFFFIFKKELWHWKKASVLFAIISFFLVLPMYKALTSSQGSIRANQVSVMNNAQSEVYQASINQEKAGSTIISKILYNRRIIYAKIIMQGYISHFSWDFLFTKGDPEGRHSTRGMGMLYLWELPAILLGLYILFWKMPWKTKWIVVAWVLIAPIPASIAVPTPHALRSLNMLPMPEVLSGLGIFWLFLFLKGKWKIIAMSIIALIIALCFSYYLYLYYGSNAKATSSDFADGYKELLEYIVPIQSHYDKIVISGHYWKPYIYTLYYTQYNPSLYQKNGHWYGFGKYVFGGTSWGAGEHELDYVDLKKFAHANHLLVALSPMEYQHQKFNLRVLKKIYDHNGQLVFIVGWTP